MSAVSARIPLARAVFGLLNVGAIKDPPPAGAGCVGGVTDNPAQGRPFPYLWYELDERTLPTIGRAPAVKETLLRLHVFSTSDTFEESDRILDAAAERLLYAVLQLSAPWTVVPVDRDLSRDPLPFEELAGVKVLELVGQWLIHVYA